MFDIGWQELGLTAVVALLVLGPKELPGLMRTAGQLTRKAKAIANEFRFNLENMAEEVEVEEYRQEALKKAAAQEPLLPHTLVPIQEKVPETSPANTPDPPGEGGKPS